VLLDLIYDPFLFTFYSLKLLKTRPAKIKIGGLVKRPQIIREHGIPDSTGEVLDIKLLLGEFVACYLPVHHTVIQPYTLSGRLLDDSPSEAYAWVKLIGYISGDFNGDGTLSLMDIIYLINYLYKGGQAPRPTLDAGDLDCSGDVNLLDVMYLINYLFRGGPAPGC